MGDDAEIEMPNMINAAVADYSRGASITFIKNKSHN
jgi:hypothetical protein